MSNKIKTTFKQTISRTTLKERGKLQKDQVLEYS